MFLYTCIKSIESEKDGKKIKVYEVRGMNYKTEEKPQNTHRKFIRHESWIEYTTSKEKAIKWVSECLNS